MWDPAGPLKYPWSMLSRDQVKKFDFDANPDAAGGGDACISNRAGKGTLHIARDPRSSSLHLPSEEFMQRFGHDDMRVVREIPVRLETVDRLFDGRANEIDLIDINAEGHDLMVLQGARDILAAGLVKLLKVEFELAAAWEGQGYFGDIDEFMRGQGYVLADLQIRLLPSCDCEEFSCQRRADLGEVVLRSWVDALGSSSGFDREGRIRSRRAVRHSRERALRSARAGDFTRRNARTR